MGVTGPVPNREDDLTRPRVRRGKDEVPVTKGIARPVKAKRAPKHWHPIAKRIYKSMRESGQADFYQESDWAYAYVVCEELSNYFQPRTNYESGEKYHKISGQSFQAIMSAMSNLLLTEGDRRRVRLELETPKQPETPAAVKIMADYRESLGDYDPDDDEDE